MTHALTLTLPIKQDAQTQAKLQHLDSIFATEVQGKIEEALRNSHIVHFARVDVIDNKYIQVITEYEESHEGYAEFFRDKLTPIFEVIFSLAEGAPDVNDPAAFWNYSKAHNVRSLGVHPNGDLDMEGRPAGWLFSAYDHKDVRTIQAALGAAGTQGSQVASAATRPGAPPPLTGAGG